MTPSDIKDLRHEFFDKAETHFMIYDKDLNIIDVNESLLKYYQVKKEQLIGLNFLDISPESKAKGLYESYLNVIKTGKPAYIEDSISYPEYGTQTNKLKIFKVGDGVGVSAINITELKNTIDALELFSHRISHDVHSPIANIMGLTELALDTDSNADEIRSYCEMIGESIMKLNNTVEMINQTLKMHTGEYNFELIDFATILKDVKESLTFIDGFAAMSFEEHIMSVPDFYFDKTIIISLFQNLIDNAIKYRKLNATDNKIAIKVTGNENYVNVTVSDNGIGIANEQQKNIFKLFHRATNQGTGNGVGLYTLKFGLQKLGGNILFESTPEVGTTFSVSLPNKINQRPS